MSTKRKLSDVLQNEENSLENRLKIALSTFTVADFSSVKNKEIVLQWLRTSLQENHSATIYSVLKSCIANVTDVWLHPQLSDPIISMIGESERCRESIDCAVELLKSVHFLRYFIHNAKKLAGVIEFVIYAVKSCELEDEIINDAYENVIDCVLNVNNNALYNNDLKTVFVKDLVQPLSVLVNSNEKFANSVENCFYQVLFTDVELRNAFTKHILGTETYTDREQYVIEIVEIIRGYPARFSTEELATSFALLFGAYLLSNSNYDNKFKIFVALNNFVEICPCPLNDASNVTLNKQSIMTADGLVKKILKYDLPLDSSFESFDLLNWLSAFVNFILDDINGNLEVSVLLLLQNVLNCSPHVMENCIKKFAKKVMLLKKSDQLVISTYSTLCLDVLNVHIKLNRMHKLISALLVTIKENLGEFSNDDVPDKFDVLPEQIFSKIQSAVTNLPSTVQNVALLNTLLYHLKADCIGQLKTDGSKQVGSRLVLIFDLVSYLISRFISGTRIADHSVPDVVRAKFTELMNNLAELLGEFGKAIISKEHHSKLMVSFLHLCHVWGEMQLIFMMYEYTRRKVPKQVGNLGKLATNLVYLHPYLSDYHWQLFAQRVVNFGDENCHRLLNDLVLQKIHALSNLEDEISGPYIDDGPATVCARYLITHADGKWLFDHIAEFVHLLKPEEVFTLSQSLVSYYEESDHYMSLGDENLIEMRPLVLAMLCSAFYSIGKQFAKSNLKELKRMLRKLKFESMLEIETSCENQNEFSLDIVDTILELGAAISKDFEYVDRADDVSVEKSVSLLVSLPAASLSRPNRSVVFYLTLSLMKNLIKLKFQTQSVENLLENISKLLMSVAEDVIIADTLSINEELLWFYRGLKNTSHCQAVLECLCRITEVSYSSVLASDDTNAEQMEVIETEDETLHLDAQSFSDQLPKTAVENLSKLNRYWRLAVKENNQKIKQRILSKACRLVQKYIISGNSADNLLTISPVTKTFLKIFIEIIQNKKFALRYPMIDLCFELISFATTVNPDDELLIDAVELLFGICKVRMPLVLDRIPTFYLCYKNLYVEVAKRSSEGETESLTCAAHKLEKLTDVLHKYRKDFSKTAISAIADFVAVFTEHNIEDEVKMHLKNVIYCWINMCDSPVQQYLAAKLSPVSQKLFQQFWSDYNKYYKFSGKV